MTKRIRKAAAQAVTMVPGPCSHPNLRRSILGLTCRDCRESWPGDPATVAVFTAMNARALALATELENAWNGLLALGAQPCERCGKWGDPKQAAAMFTAEHDGGDVVLCRPCVAEALADEEDEFLFSPELGAYPYPIERALVRWALTLSTGMSERARVLARFPDIVKEVRSV